MTDSAVTHGLFNTDSRLYHLLKGLFMSILMERNGAGGRDRETGLSGEFAGHRKNHIQSGLFFALLISCASDSACTVWQRA